MAPPLDLLNASDTELAEKLRRDDPEQYLTLVRMHLSFVLDLSAEDCDNTSEKSKFRKWGPFKKCSKSSIKGVMEGAPLTQEGICQVYQLIEFLSKEQNISQEGVFRRSGKMTRQQELKALLNQGTTLNLDDGKFSVHDCASVLKNFLADLPEPLLTDAHYQAHCQIAEMCAGDLSDGSSRLQRALQLLLMLLPAENRLLLSDVLQMLHLAASHESTNKMSADNLATLFTPHLLCPRKLPPEELHVNSQVMSRVVSFMITQGTTLFNVPPKLATDIRAYWIEREKHKQEGEAEAGTAASTVFSFVDRQLTAQANSSNPTEAALANLYAHIQSLPESANKRRLVKQFNKENGHGTPLHIKKTQARSFGDSIKKHIFTKGLKRQKAQVNQNISTDDLIKSPESPPTQSAPKKEVDAIDKPTSIMDSTPARPSQAKRRVQICEDDAATLRVSSSPTPTSSTPIDQSSTPNPWNTLQLTTSTPAVVIVSNNISNSPKLLPCTPICDKLNKSMSPITRSTHRMPRSMQETMMTPRSRKPVLVLSSSNLAQFGSWNEETSMNPPQKDTPSQTNETSLTNTFRDYLLSRSVLTASPISLSANPSPDKLSNSLLYCLDGNEPSSNASETGSSISSSGSRKRSGDSLFADQSISLSSDSAKKSTLESSYSSSTIGSSCCVRETSL